MNSLNPEEFFPLVSPLLNNEKARIWGLDYLGRYYMEKEVADSTIYYGNQIYELSIGKTDSLSYEWLSKAYNMLAVGYGFKGLVKIRGEYHLRGLDLFEKQLVTKEMSVHHIRGLADYYLDQKEYDKAIPFYKKSIEIDENNNTVYFSYNNLGQIYTRKGEFKNALYYLKKACEAPEGYKARGYCLESISACYLKMEKFDEAIFYGELVQEMFEDKDLKFVLLSRNTMAKAYHHKKDYQRAVSIYNDLLEKVKSKGFIDIEIEILKNLSSSLKIQDRYKEADEFTTYKYKLKDSLLKIQKDKEIAELLIKYDILDREKKIELLRKNQEIKDNLLFSERKHTRLLFYGFLFVTLSSCILLIVYRQKLVAKNKLNKQQEEINEERIKSIIKGQELKLVKTSLDVQNTERKRIAQDLHDSIGGNLAAINLKLGSVKKQNQEFSLIKKQIDETYRLVRKISHNLIPDNFYGNRFTEVLEEYLNDLVKANNLRMTFSAFPKKEIDVIDEKLSVEVFRIIQELLTNTFKHAKATAITVQIDLLKDNIHIMYEDNGVGFVPDPNKEGIGLRSIRNRLKKLDGKIMVDSVVNRGTILDIEIKVIK
ncbi:sensor histidine kinase [uncultured Aquimarina sp.]|uniref:tetratricopeptide repeat-containing sensor histidine kinase n=1 Tax=uncultured Aquimarina sp. TaxID=575652 RepID=UPI00261A7BBC|nr:sensor histidine kinase [uncultured Aquimarina sp.]